jgi:hypothetical protein
MEKASATVTSRKDEEALAQVASRIRPLPENVTPSVEFLRRTRLRLLKLEPSRKSAAQQAA